MKTFFATFIVSTSLIFAMNSYFDVSGLNTFDRVTELTRKQKPKDLLVWESLFDQRAWVKERIAASTVCPDIIVLGSSTMGGFSEDLLSHREVLNAWLTGASVEDFEAVTEILREFKCSPKVVLMGLDAWLFNPLVQEDRWLSVAREAMSFRSETASVRLIAVQARSAWATFKERFNFVSSRESFRELIRALKGRYVRSEPYLSALSPEEFCKTISVEYYIRAFDGHFISCPQFFKSTNEVQEIGEFYVARNTHQMADWPRVEFSRIARIDAVSKALRSSGSTVVWITPPYHPAAYAALTRDPKISANLAALDAMLSTVAKRNGYNFLNARNPDLLGCRADEFADSHHFRRPCFAKLVDHLGEYLR